MPEWTEDDVAAYAARFGLTWLTPELSQLLRAAMLKAAAEGQAVPRMPTEFFEPAHVFRGPACTG